MKHTVHSRRRLVENAVAAFKTARMTTSYREVEWLLQEAEGISRLDFVTSMQEAPEDCAVRRFREWVERRLKGEPFQYITGSATFYGRDFRVSPDVLIPRPETELVVDCVLHAIDQSGSPCVVLDVGTGSGCIATTLALECPGADVIGIDVSAAAPKNARRNAEELGVGVTFMSFDLLSEAPPPSWRSGIDVMVSNPPYIPDDERDSVDDEVAMYEPAMALFSGADALGFYRGLARLGAAVLAPSAFLIVETHADYGVAVADLFTDYGYAQVSLKTDLAGRDRVVTARKIHLLRTPKAGR